jgi:GNAT superfamily N-acetyltransferase
MQNSATIRLIRADELPDLLNLYRHLHPDDSVLPLSGDLERKWQQILSHPHLHYLVADSAGRMMATCTLTLIPNLTRAARPYALIENVVTHPDFRRQGVGTRLLQAALALAWTQDCYKVMLMTGRTDAGTLRFYQQAGFEAGVKTAFVARHP